jgi:hypothetical protein
MDHTLSDTVVSSGSIVIDQKDYRTPAKIESEGDICSSKVEIPSSMKSFFCFIEKGNWLVRIKANLKLSEEFERIKKIKELSE